MERERSIAHNGRDLCSETGNLNKPPIMRSASNFKKEVLRKLYAFYDLADKTGYSNQELSRIQSCIKKIEETSLWHYA